MNLVLLGAPGAGKGTVAQELVAEFGVAHISTGDLLRAAVKGGTELGIQAKKYMDAGELVPDQLVIDLVKERLAADDAQQGFILDGFPRTIPQAEALDKMGVRIDRVLEIYVPDEKITARLSGRRVCEGCGASYHVDFKPTKVEGKCNLCGANVVQRIDDKPETVIARLKTYYEKTAPLKDYYMRKGKLITVQGQEEIAETSKLTLAAVEAK